MELNELTWWQKLENTLSERWETLQKCIASVNDNYKTLKDDNERFIADMERNAYLTELVYVTKMMDLLQDYYYRVK